MPSEKTDTEEHHTVKRAMLHFAYADVPPEDLRLRVPQPLHPHLPRVRDSLSGERTQQYPGHITLHAVVRSDGRIRGANRRAGG